MTTKDNVPVKGHEYDGIKEFDNPLPMWWLLTFLGTIIFSFIYVLHYHTETKNQIVDEYKADLFAIQNATGPNANQPITAESLKAVAMDTSQIEKGRGIFTSRCGVCHGPDGGGGIGPNLCDNAWIHGKGKVEEIAATIQNGVLDKGMPAWGSMMGRDEVMQVTAFVGTLKGSRPSNPKAPQGIKAD